MMKKSRMKIGLWFDRHLCKYEIIAIVLCFPLFIGGIYALPIPQVIAVDVGELLTYYATAFGILGSFMQYRYEVKKRKKERNKELKPTLEVQVSRNADEKTFNIKVKNYSDKILKVFDIYEHLVEENAEKERLFRVGYNLPEKDVQSLCGGVINVEMERNIIGDDGYPKSVMLLCEDIDENMWLCNFNRVGSYYYPEDFEIL